MERGEYENGEDYSMDALAKEDRLARLEAVAEAAETWLALDAGTSAYLALDRLQAAVRALREGGDV